MQLSVEINWEYSICAELVCVCEVGREKCCFTSHMKLRYKMNSK